MKKIVLIAMVATLALASCKKDETIYDLTFTANHGVTQENQFCNPYGYYSWEVWDKNHNTKWKQSDYVTRTTVSGKAIARKGDYVWIYISVNDVFDYGSVACKSSDGSINIIASTNNLYIDDSESKQIKRRNININGKDTSIKVKEIRFKIQ